MASNLKPMKHVRGAKKRTPNAHAAPKSSWLFPPFNTKGNFVFMSVDVIGHTQLLKEARAKADFEFEHFDKMLNDLPEAIRHYIRPYDEDLLWYWAGDGGMYAFPGHKTGLDRYDYVIRCAESILDGLVEFNKINHNLNRPIKLRIAIDRDKEAVYRQEPSFRRSMGLNVAAKLKVRDDENSIAITSTIYEEFSSSDHRSKFVPLPPADENEADATSTYVHARFAKQSLASKAQRHVSAGQPLFAAHCEYRSFTIDFGRGDLDGALESIARALESLDQEPSGRYYTATLRRFFEGWQSITQAVNRGHLSPKSESSDRLTFLTDKNVRTYLAETFGPVSADLVPAMEYMQEQFDLIARRYVGGPRSLAVLDMTGLLLRTGFSPLHESEALAQRIQRFVQELETHGWKIDDECSLCTARALSCMALANECGNGRKEIMEWFERLGKFRFAYLGKNYTGAAEHEHAMHYAASVAQSLIDSGGPKELLLQVIDAFFPQDKSGVELSGAELLDDWLRWRSEASFWVCSYIFSMFLAVEHHPHFRDLLDPYRERIKQACEAYLALLDAESEDAKIGLPGYLYAFRENLAALTLGRKLGVETCTAPLDQVVKIFQKKVERVVERYGAEQKPNEPRQQYPFDSSIDRTVRFMDNWLRYFESTLLDDTSNTSPSGI